MPSHPFYPRERQNPSRLPAFLIALLLAAGLVGCDHASKEAAIDLANKPVKAVVFGILDLRYAENHDTAFSLLSDVEVPHKELLLLLLSSLALAFVVTAWTRTRARLSAAQHIGFGMVLGGAVGNLVDRALRGYVVDFIHVTHWPVFNVADIAVVGGVMLLALARGKRKTRRADGRAL